MGEEGIPGGWPSFLCPFQSPTPILTGPRGTFVFFSKGAAFSKPLVFLL